VIGIIGEDGAGAHALLRLAARVSSPVSGVVETGGSCRLLGPSDALDLSPVRTLLLEHTLALHDALVRTQARASLERLRRQGSTILIVSHEEDLLRTLSDEVWWLDSGKLVARGDPAEVLRDYRHHIARRARAWGAGANSPVSPSMRRGDGRAEVLGVETLDDKGQPAMVWQSGEPAGVRVTVRFRQPVADPVVGIMIRTRIGFEVYGTNTELEQVKLGPCAAGETLRIFFSFRCDLCPEEYTLTAASHDPDGVWHDWLEDAVAFSVADSRYTAGVANLKAKVTVEERWL
jgi:lipopolysaccharide transport system ATP-binding protein